MIYYIYKITCLFNQKIYIGKKISLKLEDGLEIELGISGNFKGFIQYRKTLVGENITK